MLPSTRMRAARFAIGGKLQTEGISRELADCSEIERWVSSPLTGYAFGRNRHRSFLSPIKPERAILFLDNKIIPGTSQPEEDRLVFQDDDPFLVHVERSRIMRIVDGLKRSQA